MFDIAFCIPTFNEERTISNVAAQIDAGLQAYYPELLSVIVNADSASTDRTRQNFLEVRTTSAKASLVETDGPQGKGINLSRFFHFALSHNVKAAVTIDGDMESVEPAWVKQFLDPILQSEQDYVFPVYRRFRYDGAITSQFCVPLIAGAFGVYIRQPIGGDFGFSARFLKNLVESPLHREAQRFGIDIFLTTRAITNRMNLCGISLGRKIHRKRERATLGPMFAEVAESLFMAISKDSRQRTSSNLQRPTIIGDYAKVTSCPSVPVDLKAIERLFTEGVSSYLATLRDVLPKGLVDSLCCGESAYEVLTDQVWLDTIRRFYCAYEVEKSAKIFDALVALFFGRLAYFVHSSNDQSDAEVEARVENLASLFNQRWQLDLKEGTGEAR